MIVACAVLGDIANRTDHHHQSRTLMTVHPTTVIAHAMYTVTEASLGPRTAPDFAPLWRVVVRTVMWIELVYHAPAVPVFSKGTGMVGQGLWQVNLEL